MTDPKLRADCGRCAALCCVGLAFDKSDHFAFDKPAGEPCRHLGAADRCAIHDRLEGAGFSGCAHYECYGAGQRVVQELFAGRSWRDDPALAAPMFDALRKLRQVHELLLLLETAEKLPLAAAERRQSLRFRECLDPAEGWTRESLAALELGSLADDVHAFLRSLRPRAARSEFAAVSRVRGVMG